MTDLARICSTAPFVVAASGASPVSFARVNDALGELLDGQELDMAILGDLLVAGARALSHARADATVSAVRAAQADVRDALSEARREWERERETLRRESNEMRSTLVAQANTYAAQASEASQVVINRTLGAAQELITSLPVAAQQQLAPHLDRFRSDLVASASQVMDPANGGAGASLADLVKRILDDHHIRNDRRIGEMETLLRLREQAVEDRDKSSAKGTDFETELFDVLENVCTSAGLTVRATGDEVGTIQRSKKGDFVIYGDGDTPLVAVEAKNRNDGTTAATMHREIDEMLRNRECSAALWVTKGVAQNKNKVLAVLGENRWSVALEDDTEGIVTAVVLLAVSVARRGVSSQIGDVDIARSKVQEALTAAGELDTLQKGAQAVVKAADDLSGKLIPVRTRIVSALQDAAAALSEDNASGSNQNVESE